ncbi:kielin/chordin-like protein [Cottoperca gobio]|uniref:Kielin/chordin-like protein n=1 Tax=Cottoperca gobio TaxID=56716 RepID=A0A6J2QSL4_COTGO|nr:kielin/chordin-like protein [Cottoperca gobio]
MQSCLGNNMCTDSVVCTVTGSTVIDFFHRALPVPDRCTYTLMKPQGSSEFTLLAAFQERRRKDVPLLDHLILLLPGPSAKLYLEQGGRVRMDEETLTLNSTAQTFHGVELSKDQTGVTATLPFSNMTLFFDGNTVHVQGPTEAFEGLCGNPTSFNSIFTLVGQKSSLFSQQSCQIQHNDTVDNSVNCNCSTEHCQLMRQAPFTACHSYIDPEPYITACTDTLCKYPSVDNMKCQFVEAYAKSCILRNNVTLEGWRALTGCCKILLHFIFTVTWA